jgi:hypothetical protein
MKTFIIEDEDSIPAELLNAKVVECKTCIGWIETDSREFRCDVEYRVKL